MRKFTFLLVAVIGMFVSTANAQSQGDMYAGGNLSFGISSWGGGYTATSTSFGLAPEFGYFVADNMKVGIEIEYSYSGINTMLFMPNFAYYLSITDNFFYTPQVSAGGGFAASKGYSAGAFALGLNLGSFEFRPKENIGLSLDLVNLEYAYMSKTNAVSFSLLSAPSVGFRYYF